MSAEQPTVPHFDFRKIPLHRPTPSSSLQAKLEVGSVNDPLEREADAVADRVMRTPDASSSANVQNHASSETVQRKCTECEDEEKLQRKADGSSTTGTTAPSSVHEALSSPGVPLDAPTRAFMEPRFGRDFGGVRLHRDEKAVASAGAVGALAYTVGQDIVMGGRAAAPGTADGNRLLAHELAHVVQQTGAGSRDVGVLRRDAAPPTCSATFAKAATFRDLISLLRAAEAKLVAAGIASVDDQIKTLRGIYYGTTWSQDFKVEKSATRNAGFQLFTGTTSAMTDPHSILDCGLFEALQQSQDVSDGTRSVDFGHLIIALDARESFVARNAPLPFFGGTGLEIVTWLGDLGGGAANLAIHRASAPGTSARVSFSGTDYGASSNLEGDVAGYVTARGTSTSVGAPVIASGKGLADEVEAYLSPGKPGTEWKDRATTFLSMNGGTFDAAGNLTNATSLSTSMAGSIETFACQYLGSRLKDGKISTSTFNAATDHVTPASEEVAQTFVFALEDCHRSGGKLEAKRFPAPKPAAPGACTVVKGAVGATKGVGGALDKAEKGATDLWRRLTR